MSNVGEKHNSMSISACNIAKRKVNMCVCLFVSLWAGFSSSFFLGGGEGGRG